MSVKTASKSNINGNNIRDIPYPNIPLSSSLPAKWVRPSDWLTLPTLSVGDAKFTGLVAVYNDSVNDLALSVTCTGNWTIDWGDGTTANYTGTQTLTKTYDYATLSSTVSTRGYKMAIVNITMTSLPTSWTGLTICSNTVLPTGYTAVGYTPRWLDVAIASSSVTTFLAGGTLGGAASYLLEQITIVQMNTLNKDIFNGNLNSGAVKLQSIIINNLVNQPLNMITLCKGLVGLVYGIDFSNITFTSTSSISEMYSGCTSLVSVPDFPSSFRPSSLSSTFLSCRSLISAPAMDTSSVTTCANAFQGCSSLNSIPSYNLTSCTTTASMFQSCNNLNTAPALVFSSSLTTMTSMFQDCLTLTNTPNYNTPGVTSTLSMFQACTCLKFAGTFNLPALTDGQSMFNGCINLEVAPLLVTGTALNFVSSMFSGCYKLQNGAVITNTSNVTNFSGMYASCLNLINVPTYDTSNATDLGFMFQNCVKLKNIPSFNTIKATSMSSMFSGCTQLENIPTFNTSNNLNFTNMFLNCFQLDTAPAFDTTKATAMPSMFSSCYSLTTIPTYNTGNVLNFSGFIANCVNLSSVPSITTNAATNCNVMFNGCSNLNSIPALNFATTTTNNVFGSSGGGNQLPVPLTNLSSIAATNVKVTFTVFGSRLNKANLENVFANVMISNTTAQTITITSSLGADTAITKTSGTTAGSNTITMTNTVGVTTGSYLYGVGVNTGIPVTFADAGDTVVYTNGGGVNGLANGDNVMFTAIVSTTGIVTNTTYFVVNRTGTTFQVASTLGGTALPLTTNGTGTMSIGGATISNQVVTVNANANVIISGVAGVTNASVTLTNRKLNQNYATTKNWTVTG